MKRISRLGQSTQLDAKREAVHSGRSGSIALILDCIPISPEVSRTSVALVKRKNSHRETDGALRITISEPCIINPRSPRLDFQSISPPPTNTFAPTPPTHHHHPKWAGFHPHRSPPHQQKVSPASLLPEPSKSQIHHHSFRGVLTATTQQQSPLNPSHPTT
jgi:hypothetical protein